MIFKTEVVNGVCPTCQADVVFVSLAQALYRCTNCGSDLEQKVNGVISYIPATSNMSPNKPVLKSRRIGWPATSLGLTGSFIKRSSNANDPAGIPKDPIKTTDASPSEARENNFY
jgi:DNA-directed RNA polymerase subunit RPC12/RpoP